MIRYLLTIALCACSTVHETEPPACDVAPADIALPSGCYEDEPACEPSWSATPPDLLPCVRHYVCDGSCVTAYDCECIDEVAACLGEDVAPGICQ
jgi:hypothetical protein